MALTSVVPASADITFEKRGTRYTLELLRGPSLGRLVPLYRTVYRRDQFTPEWLEQKYACAYGAASAFVCAAFTEDGTAAAAAGVLAWPIRFGDHTEIAGQLVDVATDANHRGRGLFSRLSDMAHALAAQAGMSFMFAFPFHQGDSYPRLVGHLGYAHIDDLLESSVPIRTGFAERAMRRAGALRRIYQVYAERTLAALAPADPAMTNSLIADGFAATDRTESFYAYKAFGGSRVVALKGGRVWINLNRGLLVGDLEAPSPSALAETSRALEQLAVRLSAHRIIFQASRGTRFARLFEPRIPATPMLAVVYRNFDSAIPREKLRFTFGDLDNF